MIKAATLAASVAIAAVLAISSATWAQEWPTAAGTGAPAATPPAAPAAPATPPKAAPAAKAPAAATKAPAAKAGETAPAGPAAPPEFAAGKEVRVNDASLGGEGYYLVYLPKDYTADRTWPAVFNYHGLNQHPQTWPFKDLTGGKGFIVIGMCYAGGNTLAAYNSVSKDVESVKRLVGELTPKLHIESRQLFIGGFSMGGFMTSEIGEKSSSMWAAMAICGAGRQGGSSAAGFRGKPVFCGAGEKDSYLPANQAAAKHYLGVGAEVTSETWPGMGHSVDAKSKVFADWMWASGPFRQVKADIAAAKALEAAGKLGEAHAAYTKVAALSADYPACADAKKAADAIAKTAGEQLAAAEESVAAKRYGEAVATLSRAAASFSGSAFGEKARKRLDEIRTDPAINATIDLARQNSDAKLLSEQAQVAETAKDYARAIKSLEQLVATCPRSDLFAAAGTRLAALKADKSIQASIANKDAERECKGWLAMADNFIKADAKDKAKEYLQKILDKYPGTDFAAQAKERLNALR